MPKEIVIVNKPKSAKKTAKRRRRNRQRNKARRQLRGAININAGKRSYNPNSIKCARYIQNATCIFSDSSTPFGDFEGSGIPDKYSGPTAKPALETTVTAKADANGEIRFVVAPCLPGALWWGTGEVTYTNMGGNSTVEDSTGKSPNEPYHLIPFATMVPNDVIVSPSTAASSRYHVDNNPFDFTKMRVCGMGYEVKPLGTPLTTQGLIYTQVVPIELADSVPNLVSFDSSMSNFSAGAYMTRTMRNFPRTVAAVKVGRYNTHEVKEGCLAQSKFDFSENYDFARTSQLNANDIPADVDKAVVYETEGFFPVVDSYKNATASATALAPLPLVIGEVCPDTAAASFDKMPVSSIDSRLQLGLCFMEGLQPGYPVEVKVRMAVEGEVDPASILRNFTSDSPEYDPMCLAKVGEVNRLSPSSVPASMNAGGGFWNIVKNILKGIGGVSRIAAGINLPIISPVAAGVTQIIDAFDL